MLLAGDVSAITVLIKARMAQHQVAIQNYQSDSLASMFTRQQLNEFVSVEQDALDYYTGLLARFQQSVDR